MVVVLGLILLIAAVVVGVAGVLANAGSGHALTSGFAVFGYHVTGSTGTLFLLRHRGGCDRVARSDPVVGRCVAHLPPRSRCTPRTEAVPSGDRRSHRPTRRPGSRARDHPRRETRSPRRRLIVRRVPVCTKTTVTRPPLPNNAQSAANPTE